MATPFGKLIRKRRAIKCDRRAAGWRRSGAPDFSWRSRPDFYWRADTGGADAVVMQEDATREGDEIVVNVGVDPGEFIRRRGCDLAEGQKILARGERIRSTTIALLASQGFADVTVGGEVNAAIVSTGDEVVMPGRSSIKGRSTTAIRYCFRHWCSAAARSVTSAEHCPDQRERLIEAIQRGIKSHVLVITGGVSVGEHDLVQAALRSLGAKIDIWRVAIKPGKPFLFGRSRWMRCLRFAGKSCVSIRHFFAVCASSDLENDGRERTRSAESSRQNWLSISRTKAIVRITFAAESTTENSCPSGARNRTLFLV